MYAKLPQEIRDMVYAYLYLEDAPIPIGSHHFTTYVEPADDDSQVHRAFNDANTPFIIPEGAVTHDHSIAPPSGVVLPTDRTLNPVYLGHQVAFEASKFYYSSNIFSICTLFNTLSTFLFTDPARGFARSPESKVQPLGLLPIDYVRSLQIRIKYEHFRTYAIKPEPSTGRRPEKTVYRGIFSNLGPLREWGERTASPDRRAEFIIMTAFRTRHDALNLRTRLNVLSLELQNRRFTNLLEAMRPSIYTLKHDAGANISVLHHDETWTPFPRNISAIFSLTKTQWEYVSSTYSVFLKSYPTNPSHSTGKVHPSKRRGHIFAIPLLDRAPIRRHARRRLRVCSHYGVFEGTMGSVLSPGYSVYVPD